MKNQPHPLILSTKYMVFGQSQVFAGVNVGHWQKLFVVEHTKFKLHCWVAEQAWL